MFIYRNDLLERIITGNESWIHFYKPERKSASMVWKKKKGEEVLRKLKHEWSTRPVMLKTFWDCDSLVYTEFGPDAGNEMQNITQGTYFHTLVHLRNVTWSSRRGLLNQQVVLIHDNARPHSMQIFIKNSLNTINIHQT